MAEKPPQLKFDRSFEPHHGAAVELSPLLTRVTAPNSGPFTFHGTNSYLVGQSNGSVAIIDPGPIIEPHRDALIDAVGDRPVSHVVVTHTHVDHSPLARPLSIHFNAPLVGCRPHRAARAMADGEVNALDASGDKDYAPDTELFDGERIDGDGWTLTTHATPGHTINHLSFVLEEERALIAGDHVMAWSTSIVAPPDGSMKAYMASLQRTLALDPATCWPGHGGPVLQPQVFIEGLIHHRTGRERAILKALSSGPSKIRDMVPGIYIGLDPALHGAAALSLFAHLEDLHERNAVQCDGAVTLDAVFSR